MTMTCTAWLALFSICLLGAMVPGASLTLIVRQTMAGGHRQGVAAAIGHGSGVALYALATVQGLALVLVREPWLFHLLTWIGAAYLLWLGINSFKAGAAGSFLDGQVPVLKPWQAARQGLVVSLSNPKLVIFFVALFGQFVTPGLNWLGHLQMILTASLLDMSWYCLVALFLSRPAILQRLQRRSCWVNRTCGLMMILLGLRVLTL